MTHTQSIRPPLRVGVVGAGRIVERAHLPLLVEHPQLRLVGIFDPSLERAALLARQHGIARVCGSLEELLGLSLDITLVACPNYLHAPVSIAALEAGSHVLCEKPMATSAADAEAMDAAQRRTGRTLMIAFPNRFRPEVTALHQAIAAGELGLIRDIRCGWLRRDGIPGANTWFTNRALSGGGALTDLGAHLLDLSLWLAGPRQLRTVACALDNSLDQQAQASWYSAPSSGETQALQSYDVEVGGSALASFEGPLNLLLEVSWACSTPADRTYLEIRGTEGSARLETLFGFSPHGQRPDLPLQIWSGGAPPRLVPGSNDLLQPYRAQLAFFIDSLHTNRSLVDWGCAGLQTARLIEAMYKAAGVP